MFFVVGLLLIFGVMWLVNIVYGDLIVLVVYFGLSMIIVFGVYFFFVLLIVMFLMVVIGYVF